MANYSKYQKEHEEEMKKQEMTIKVIPIFLFIETPPTNKGWARKGSTYKTLPAIDRTLGKNEFAVPFLMNPKGCQYYDDPKFRHLDDGSDSLIVTEFNLVFSLPEEMELIVKKSLDKALSKTLGKDAEIQPAEYYYSTGGDFTTEMPTRVAFNFGRLTEILGLEPKIR